MLSDLVVKTQEIISGHKQDEAGPAEGSKYLGGTRRTCASEAHHQRQSSPNNAIAHEESPDVHWCGRNSVLEFFTDDKKSRRGRRRGVCVAVWPRGLMALLLKVDMLEPIAENMLPEPKNRQQAMNSP